MEKAGDPAPGEAAGVVDRLLVVVEPVVAGRQGRIEAREPEGRREADDSLSGATGQKTLRERRLRRRPSRTAGPVDPRTRPQRAAAVRPGSNEAAGRRQTGARFAACPAAPAGRESGDATSR